MEFNEKIEIANKLQNHHYFFRAFWDIGEPEIVTTGSVKTAAITFDKSGESIKLTINRNFWDSLNSHSKLFLICHEMCHILLRHGRRFAEFIGTKDFTNINYASDVVINEMLCKHFGFDRESLDTRISHDGCWINTVFKNIGVEEGQSTDYYFNKLKDNQQICDHNMTGKGTLDDHDVMSESAGEDDIHKVIAEAGLPNILDRDTIDILEDAAGLLPNDIAFGGGLFAGTGAGNEKFSIKIKKKKKAKWETVIKKWEAETSKTTFDSTERWERVNPRYSHILGKNIHLPTTCNVLNEYKKKDKMEVYFFLDVSGSCVGLRDRFFTAANSLNPKKFKIRPFIFDTSVTEIDLKTKSIFAGGGTRFDIMEQKIQYIMRHEKTKYPHAVFVITDGYGTNISPQKPERWYWFLSSTYENHIPEKSKRFKLSNYE